MRRGLGIIQFILLPSLSFKYIQYGVLQLHERPTPSMLQVMQVYGNER